MNTAVIKINNLDQALMLSRAYKEGEIKLNVSKLARELNCSRKTLSRRLNGIAPKKTRNRNVNSKIKITKKVGIIITSFGNEKLS